MSAKLFVIGIDAATWKIIIPNLDKLPTFEKLVEKYGSQTIALKERAMSPSVWCSMFSGKLPEQHDHRNFVVDGKIQTREDIKVDFVWDLLNSKCKVAALNVPFIVPPYNFNVDFKAPASGIPITFEEMDAEIEQVTEKATDIAKKNIDLLVTCFVSLDKLQHLHWGEPIVLDYYKKIDKVVGQLLKYSEKFIIVSDHGFCSFGESKEQTLPHFTKDGKEIKGDHHEEAILITNLNYEIKKPQDVFFAIEKEAEQWTT